MVFVILAWILAYVVRFHTLLPITKTVPEFTLYLKLVPFVVLVWGGMFSYFGLYSANEYYRSALREALLILRACFLALLLFIAVTFFYEEYKYSRATILVFAVLHPILLTLGRSILRKILRSNLKADPKARVILLGRGETLQLAFSLLQKRALMLGPIAGVILIGEEGSLKESQDFCQEKNLPVLSRLTEKGLAFDWVEFFSTNFCDSILIALPHGEFHFISSELSKIADQVNEVHILDDLVRYSKFAARVRLVEQVPILSINDTPFKGSSIIFKRAMDIMGSIVALFLFSPVMLFTAIAVRLSSPGPIFYRQERMGLDGKVFSILKFRSMPVNAEKESGAVWAKPQDSRPTKVGKLIRASSIDELPQLFNVLLGDMSLVGPRPERPVFVQQFRRSVPGYMLRHKMKAGMTGWAQINGWRGDTSIEKRIECDLYYVQNWSLILDIKILFLTFFRGFFDKNAY